MLEVKFHFFDLKDVQTRHIIADALKKADIEECVNCKHANHFAQLLFFNEIVPELFDFLHSLNTDGCQQILAIRTSGSAIPSKLAWSLLQAGAKDLVVWNRMPSPANEVSKRLERWYIINKLVQSELVRNNVIGESPAWISVLRRIIEVAHFTNAFILITGETGTGKELIARLIHSLDARKDKKDLVVLDCTTIVPELSGSEFFGHERGAFTGAINARDGAFALANGGTLFLDELGELPLNLQVQLLRVIEEHMYKRVGGNVWHRTDFRLVCATNKDLLQEVAQGHFRRDLYYRIIGCIYKLPPLHERTEDILPLTQHFMKQLRPDEELPDLDEPVQEYLKKRVYQGNIRDLKQLVSRIMYRHVGSGPITIGDIPEEERPLIECSLSDSYKGDFEQAVHRALSRKLGLKEIGKVAEDTAFRIVVSEEKGNLRLAARKLQQSERALQLRRNRQREVQYHGKQ